MGEITNGFGDFKNIVLRECQSSLDQIDRCTVEQIVHQVLAAEHVFFAGVGRVMLSLQATVKRWAHLGIGTYYVGQITEPAITEKDLLIVASGSGESAFPLIVARKARSIGVKVVHIGSNANSSMKEYADIFLRIPVQTKLNLPDEMISVQPMTSLFEQTLYLLGDIMSLQIIQHKNLDLRTLWRYHANLE